ncbi:PREDICTED: protein FAF-like, chloroplastic isoform X2 [Lupinus angustifolius]|uniref:protein FAF-like, chloroplastic isoform X2 n=1 Tax=Lupinus angustifolius TaxID=3871 RepID=UPI00092EA357|nr:PREDICTED: protein FAF-like, chloroplastic isoform X2 [Lupinus angustifolius]
MFLFRLLEMSTSMSKEIQSQGLSSSEEFSHSKVTTTNAESKDLWSSILLPQKAIDETTNAIITPYIHPLVKKLKNTLSQKSLEICTESLGSETGSDGFSSKENKEEIEQKQLPQVEEITLQVPEYKSPTINFDSSVSLTIMSMEIFDQKPKKHKSSHHSFPPPMPTLHMLSHRDNGRLFLQAVFVPSNNNFCAKRKNGRLVLTFASEEESKVQEMEEDYDEEENEVENNEEKNDIKDVESMIEQPTIMSSDITSVHKLIALVMNKTKLSEKLNESFSHRPKLVRLKLQLWNQQHQLRLLSMLMKTATQGPSSLQKLLHFLTHLPINNI